MHPTNNMPGYGADLAIAVNDAALTLMLDYTQQEKELLLIRLLQYGLDIYGTTEYWPGGNIYTTVASQGGLWMGAGGHGMGRKLPVVLAGLMLGDTNISKYADGNLYPIFQEEQQHWYIREYDVGREMLQEPDLNPPKLRTTYTSDQVGIPEWGESHMYRQERDWNDWMATYRHIAVPSNYGAALVAIMMGQKNAWNWPAFFDYCDRYNQTRTELNMSVQTYESAFARDFWDTFRNDYPPVWSASGDEAPVLQGLRNKRFTISGAGSAVNFAESN
jgi:hypothetical protein